MTTNPVGPLEVAPALPEVADPATVGAGAGGGWQQAVRVLWQAATSPWLLFALSVALAFLIGLTLVVPQLPSQLTGEAGAAQRWIANASAAWGGLGRILSGLGLFRVVQSPLLQVLLVLLFFAILVHVARQAVEALALQRVPDVLDAGGVNGEPLPLPATGSVQRWRQAQAALPLGLADEMQRLLDARLRHVERRTVRVAPAQVPAEWQATQPRETQVLEERLLAARGLRLALLRPLLPLGMLAATALIWSNMVLGWEFMPPALAPGERTADAVHGVRLEYRIDQASATMLNPTLIAGVDGQTEGIPIGEDVRRQVGGADLRAYPGAPALLVRTVDQSPLLARPGQGNPVAEIGLDFPSEGSEETLVLPNLNIVLRLIRNEQGAPGPEGDTFLVEVISTESDEVLKRVTVSESDIVTVPTFGGETALAIVPLPAMVVQVRYSPGQWLLWVALALLGLGAAGFWQRPGFVLAQVGPWPEERSVVTVQSDLPDELAMLRKWYSGRHPTPE